MKASKPEAPAAWQRGFPLEDLKDIANLFRRYDEGLVLGAFTGVNERQVADWLEANRLSVMAGADGERVAAVAWREAKTRSPIHDFAGRVRGYVQPGDIYIMRLAFSEQEPGYVAARKLIRELAPKAPAATTLLEGPTPTLWINSWVEHTSGALLMDNLGASRICTKIPASSELIGVYAVGEPSVIYNLDPAEELAQASGLVRLPWGFEPEPYLDALEGLSYAGHYSSKQKGGSWAALALRGYGPRAGGADPEFIAKPQEMSKKWKRENPEALGWVLQDTEARPALGALEPLIAKVPGKHHRIRLMRLAPGGGELTRHADNTDPEAGVRDGELIRVHMPLVTNPQVRFRCWLLDGRIQDANMGAGEAWTLDTRKPHTAHNGGEAERIHLVIDTEAGPELRRQMAEGHAPE